MFFKNRHSHSLRGLQNIWRLQMEISFLGATAQTFPWLNVTRFYTPKPSNEKNFYDSLEISSKATSSQVKKAYYKLSMIYHPDQNKSAKAAIKFHEITEAYEVLSNASKRRLYDKGFLGKESTFSADKAKSYSQKMAASKKHQSKRAPVSGHTPIYNFDAWSKSHYSASFQKQQKIKAFNEFQINRQETHIMRRQNFTISLALFFFSMMFYYFIPHSVYESDVPSQKTK